MKKLCVSCENETQHVEKEVKVKVGTKNCPVKTRVCSDCGAYALTPRIRKAIDAWALAQKSNFVKLQPKLSPIVHKYLDDYTKGRALTKNEYVRLFIAFYMNDVVTCPEFFDIKKYMESGENQKMLTKGDGIHLPIPVRYATFRLVESYAAAWNVSLSNVAEEAVIFCINLKHHEDNSQLRELSEEFDSFVKRFELAA